MEPDYEADAEQAVLEAIPANKLDATKKALSEKWQRDAMVHGDVHDGKGLRTKACSFCGRHGFQVTNMVESSDGNARICGGCLGAAVQSVRQG